ncbi:N-acetylmuramoyl-L-alanine amidase [Candidatus Microgenomates bacterium]|nr:N-acetylmuramoyl-L-alanine amidase [Candidatus Microgenomates bacterium]
MKKILSFLIALVFLTTFLPRPSVAIEKDFLKNQKEISGSIKIEQTRYQSEIVILDWDFSGIASSWSKGFDGAEINFGLGQEKIERFISPKALTDDLPDRSGRHDEETLGEILTIQSARLFQYSLSFSNDDIGKTFSFRFVLFDTFGPSAQIAALSTDNSGLGPNIVSRQNWGANESYRTWGPEYAEVKAIVIHHTAGEEKAALTDQAEAVRNLYYGHAVSYGWGDVGYNYIIDINGLIYEGRYGGNSVVGGHTLGYNPGTIGIALIGDYGARNITEAQTGALADLIAYLSFKNFLSPDSKTTLKDKNINTVVGHQDLNATSCPGSNVYSQVGSIATLSAERLKNYPERSYRGEIVSFDPKINIYGGDIAKLHLTVKNTGNATWLSEGNRRLKLQLSSSSFSGGLVSFGKSIEPGQTATLSADIWAPFANQAADAAFDLIQDDQIIPGVHAEFSAIITTPSYRAKIIAKKENQNIQPGQSVVLWAEIKNMGINTWNGSENLRLVTKDGGSSVFYASGDWTNNNSPGGLDQTGVATGQVGKISFTATAPVSPGQYKEWFRLVSDKNFEGIDNQITDFLLVVGDQTGPLSSPEPKIYSKQINDYHYEIISRSDANQTLLLGETRTLSLELKNTGNSIWYSDVVRLGTVAPYDRPSIFADSSWSGKNRIEPTLYKIAPGKTAVWSFTITAPQNKGAWTEKMALVVDGVGWTNGEIVWNITVAPPTHSASLVEQSPYIKTSQKVNARLVVKLKNTGNITWQKNIVRLGTTGPYDRPSIFADSSWKSFNRLEFLESSVSPGGVATFIINLNTDTAQGIFRESFGLVADGIGWFDNIGLFWLVDISPPFDDFSYVAQSPFVMMSSGETASLWLEIKNTGTTTWQKNSADSVRLATTSPRDRKSIFLSSNRIALDRDRVVPGETVRFSFSITAPDQSGVFKEYFSPVHDGVGWLKDIGIYWEIKVEKAPPPLVTEGKTIQISGTDKFVVVDGVTLKTIAYGGKNDLATVSFTDNIYQMSLKGSSFSSSNFLRFVPQATGTILSLPSYADRPAWNPTINDNAFKGVLEIRYTPVTKKLWAINELFIEDYLSGVSEPLDSFDPEYLKVATVAERSYVYHHLQNGGKHPDEFLTLKNSRNGNGDDQIYAGYNFSLRAPNIGKAVVATKGEVVAYNDRPVITPYFSQSDGRTRSASEVWGWDQAKYPWLVGKDDSSCKGGQLLGHGVGMSGCGARGKVASGEKYQNVLNYYYSGTAIKKIDETNLNVKIGIYAINLP